MLIGILSDTHDHKTNTAFFMEKFKEKKVERLIHCGDFCSPFMMSLLSTIPTDAVFGNNDGDLFSLQKKAYLSGVILHGGFWSFELDGYQFAVYHGTYEEITQALIHCGKYEVVITGHTHIPVIQTYGKTLHLNPGSANGFDDEPTALVLDTQSLSASFLKMER